MAIKKIKIFNFKCFKEFTLELNPEFNVLVGNNEAGKSTILEAINLALTGIYRGKFIKNELSQYLFNKEIVDTYLANLKSTQKANLPAIIIEIYFSNNDLASFIGDGNSDKDRKTPGIVFSICFDEKYEQEYGEMCKSEIQSLPIEYYDVTWFSFAREVITPRTIPIKASMIDSSHYRFNNGSDVYISKIIKNMLTDEEIVGISQAHRLMRESFNKKEIISDINKKLSQSTGLGDKKVTLSVDLGTM